PATPREFVPHLSHSPIRVVGHRENQDCNSAGTVTFVRDLLIFDAFELACSFLDCAFDVVLRHRRCPRRFDCRSKPGISCGITAAELRGHCYFANELGKVRAALCVSCSLVMLDLFPLAMTGHRYPLSIPQIYRGPRLVSRFSLARHAARGSLCLSA